MPVTRRAFVRGLGLGSAAVATAPAWMHARGLEAALGHSDRVAPARAGQIRLMSNENPNGPVPAAIRAVTEGFHEAAYYPAFLEPRVVNALADTQGVPRERIMLGSGSGEILRLAVQAFCSPTRHLVTATTTFESPAEFAAVLGVPVRAVPLDDAMRLNLPGMLREVPGAGLLFVCNPNNPTGHVYGAEDIARFVRAALAADPNVVILMDEAYHEFVDDPAYASAVSMIASEPRVFVSRTFSKIYGLAGMRIGYAFGQPSTLARMGRLRLPNAVSTLAQLAAVASLGDEAQLRREQQLNRDARAFTLRWFRERGYSVQDSHTNFVFVDVRRTTARFAADCLRQDVIVGRPFPPYVNHSRISIGTMDEMRQAVEVFGRVLS